MRPHNRQRGEQEDCFKRNPLGTEGRGLTVFPLSGGWVYDAEKFIIGDSFGVQVSPYRPTLHVLVGPVERLEYLRFARASVANHKHRVSNSQELLKLNHLQRRIFFF